MLNIPEEVKELYKQDGIYKNIRIVFPNGEHEDICNDNIEQNSVQFTESLCSQDEFTLGITESPTFQADIHCTQDITGCVIDVFNEIDCTSLGSEFCAQYCEYKNDLGIYVYSIQYGQFTITSANSNHFNDKKSIDAYGNGTNYEIYGSKLLSFISKIPQPNYSIYTGLFFYSQIAAWALGKTRNLFSNSGTQVSLSKGSYEYAISNNKKIRIKYSYYEGSEQPFTVSAGLSYENRVAVIDFNKESRMIDLRKFIEKCYSRMNQSESNSLDELLTDKVFKSLYNPRYTLGFYISIYSSRVKYVSYDEFFDFYEFLECNNYEYYMSETWFLYNPWLMHSHYSDASLTDKLNSDNIPCCNGRLYIPTSIELVDSGNIVEVVNYTYSNIDVRKDVKSVIGFYRPELTSGYEPYENHSENNSIIRAKTRNYYSSSGSSMSTTSEYTYYFYNVNEVVTSINELLGASSCINRYGKMDIVFMKDTFSSVFPSETLYPSEELYPSESEIVVSPSNYIEAEYGKENEKPYGMIYANDSHSRILYDDYVVNPDNYKIYDISSNYTISSNVPDSIEILFDNIEAALENVIYMPCDIEMKALPYLEVGDTLQVVTATGGFQTIINRRTIKGEQHLIDNIEVN